MLPNLIVIGAGKCGTSSLSNYLGRHPEIFMSRRKELMFFNARLNWDNGVEWYESQFADASAPVRGESSPQYTHYPTDRGVPQRMQSVVPDAKLIYLVRDPLEKIASSYIEGYSRGRTDKSLAETLTPFATSAIVCWARYYMQLEQYLRCFPAEQILVIQSEKLLMERRATLQGTFRFLGVDDSFDSAAFDQVFNPSHGKRRVTSTWLPGDPKPAPTGLIPWHYRKRAKDLLYRPFSTPIERPRIEGELREALIEHLKPDMDRLRQFTGMSFSDWSV
jgi:hypothetical protein